MNNVPTTLVSSAIGATLLHERFDWHLAVGAAIIVAGVAAMILGRARKASVAA